MDLGRHLLLETAALVPAEWHNLAAGGRVHAFNPALLADGAGWLFAYRIVGADLRRRIALCRLDADFAVVPGSARPLSDGFGLDPARDYPEQARHWFADPRLYRFAGRLFVYWNSGWHAPANCQFLQELDPASLAPVGRARELRRAGGRRAVEKNWMLFGEEAVYCLYDPMPHAILAVDLSGEGDIVLHPVADTPWSAGAFAARYGALRGGAPPQRCGDAYVALCHAVFATPLGYAYRAAAYRFAAQFPFAPIEGPVMPLRLPNPLGPAALFDGLNPSMAEVVYPAGAARRGGAWIVSYGLNDARCAIAELAADAVEATMRPLPPGRRSALETIARARP